MSLRSMVLLALLLGATARPAAAQSPPSSPSSPGAPLAASQPSPVSGGSLAADRARLDSLDDLIARDASASKLWYWGWMSLFAANLGVQATLWGTSSDPDRVARARVGTIVGGIGFVVTTAIPPPCLFVSPGKITESDTEDQRKQIVAATSAGVDRCAAAERFGKSWLAHLGGWLLNGAASLYLWRHDGLPQGAAFQLVSGLVVGELRIWTQPSVAMDAAAAGQVGRITGARVGVWPVASPEFTGLRVGGAF